MNKYVVTFRTLDELECGLVFEIEVSVNRPNNPTDEELIIDYLNLNYGETIDLYTLQSCMLDDVVRIDKDYSIEV